MYKQLKDFYKLLKRADFLKEDNVELQNSETQINFLSFDSRKINDNTLFFCKGLHFKVEYLEAAKESGAVAYVSEIDYQIDLPCLVVKSVRTVMPFLADFFYDSPQKKLKMIGITGSKGKSTSVFYVKCILDKFLNWQKKKPVGLISGIRIFDGLNDFESELTTPEALDIYSYLSNAVSSGLEYFVVEVSSQALKYERLSGIEFDMVALLNIDKDHIGPLEHPNYEDYLISKLSIFDHTKAGLYYAEMMDVHLVENYIRELNKPILAYTTQDNKEASYQAKNIHTVEDYVYFDYKEITFKIPGLSLYNVENAVCALVIAEYFSIPLQFACEGLAQAVVPGRDMIFYTENKKIILYVSYAHNQLSFKKSFETIKSNFPNYKLIALFGASGSKGLNRIEDLPQIAGKEANYIYFIPDDPGYRKHEEIAEEMISHLPSKHCAYEAINSREEAIKLAFQKAHDSSEKTLLFIAGKGDEHYQSVEGKSVPIKSDLDVVKELFKHKIS